MRLTLPLAALALAACSPQPDGPTNTAEPAPSPTPSPSSEPSPAASAADANVDITAPPDEAGFAPATPQGAADVVSHYYTLIEEGAFDRAARLWEAGNKTAVDLSADAARYSDFRADVGAPGDEDAGAGQRYVTVPVHLHGTTTAGKPFESKATVTLHRVGEIDGATAAQKRWHIRSIE